MPLRPPSRVTLTIAVLLVQVITSEPIALTVAAPMVLYAPNATGVVDTAHTAATLADTAKLELAEAAPAGAENANRAAMADANALTRNNFEVKFFISP